MGNAFYISELLNRVIGNSQQQETEHQRELDRTIERLTASSPAVTDQYKATPQPGHGPGTYQPRARATARDTVALFVPQSAFDGTWPGFQEAASAAISWLRSNRYQVEQGGALCHGPAFDLDPEPLSYRDTGGVSWYNAAIGVEPTYQLARIHARA